MKLLTYVGRGVLVLPGIARVEQDKSVEVSDEVAAVLSRVTPPLKIEIQEISAAGDVGGDSDSESQPEAQQGEGQAIATEPQEE